MTEKTFDLRFSQKLGDDGLPIAQVSKPRLSVYESIKSRLLRAREEHQRSEAEIMRESQIVAAFDSLKNGIEIAEQNYARFKKDMEDAVSCDVISRVTWQGAYGLAPIEWRSRVVSELVWQDSLAKNQKRILEAIHAHTVGEAQNQLEAFIAENRPILEQLKLV